MIKKFYSLFYISALTWGFVSVSVPVDQDYCISFVYIGKNLPQYIYDSIQQVRLFNKTCKIYLLANKIALQKSNHRIFSKFQVSLMPIEELAKTKEHIQFLQESTHNTSFHQGFLKYTSERFLVLNDFCQTYDEKNIIHLEADVMVYVDFAELIPIFNKYYKEVAVIMDSDTRCIPGLVYFAHKNSTQKLAEHFASVASQGQNDMVVIASFFNKYPRSQVDSLPIIMPSYVENIGLKNLLGQTSKNAAQFYHRIDEFNSIFDGAAIGQYLGGRDPLNGISKPGFVNETCLFNVSLLIFDWKIDSEGRRLPYATFNGESYRINNLHIHSKNLKPFSSLR